MNKSNKFSPEVRERAVRMVQEHRGEYPEARRARACPDFCVRGG
jgi:transposase-like protein